MKTIRRNTFETNSSSTHCLTVGSGEKEFPKLDNDGNLEIWLGEYGWEIDEYYALCDRISYVFSCLYDYKDSNSSLNKLFNDLLDYIKNQTGANEIIFKATDYYVDHGDEHLILDFDWLIDFMFNKGGYFTTDNDNH